MEEVFQRIRADFLDIEASRLHAWGGGCWTKTPKKACSKKCFKGVLEIKEDFSILARKLRIAALKENNLKLPKYRSKTSKV